ncbi:hypothetical protein MBAV_000473 [Candidatus Magnetobacterium bavaricum]|uniref:Uncharacterized protein n=1 Tax=Candidatus Magnetobacterium bavaricum TaxID=29290 RepID=A0A0F3GZF0_9BACT|nr:hypothetical protein MBAV_000473 [Candidatus Magnetobacterium bavaricum]
MGTETLSPEMVNSIKQLIVETLKEMSMQAPDNLTLLFFQLSKEFRDFKEEVIGRFDKVDERFGEVDERFGEVDRRFDKVDERFDKIEREMVTKDYLDEVIKTRLVTKDDLKEALADMVTKDHLKEALANMVTKDYLKEALTDLVVQIGISLRGVNKS